MNRIEEIRENAGVRGKALLITIADIMDNVAKRNIALAGDVAGFAASQVRLPAQVVDLNDYREKSLDAYSKFGVKLKTHGENIFGLLKQAPAQISDSLVEGKVPTKRKVTKKAVSKKAPARKTAARKSAAMKAKAAKASPKPQSQKAAA